MSIRRVLPYLFALVLFAIPLGLVVWQPLKGWGAKQLFCFCVKESLGAEIEWESYSLEGSKMVFQKPSIRWTNPPKITNATSTFWWKFLFSSLSVEMNEGHIYPYNQPAREIRLQGTLSKKKGFLQLETMEGGALKVQWDRHQPLIATATKWPIQTALPFIPYQIEDIKGTLNGSLNWHGHSPSPMSFESLEIVTKAYTIEIPSLTAEAELLGDRNVVTSYSVSPCTLKTDYGNFTFMGFSTSFHSLSSKHQVAEWETVLMPNDCFSKPVPILGSITKRTQGPFKGEIIFKGDELVGTIHLNDTQRYSLILSPCGTPPFSLEGECTDDKIEGSLTLHEKSCIIYYSLFPTKGCGKLFAHQIPLYQFDHYFSFPIDLDEVEAVLSFNGDINSDRVLIEYLVEGPKLVNDHISIFFNEPLKGIYQLSLPTLYQKTEVSFNEGYLFDQGSHFAFQHLSGTLKMDDFGIYLKETKGECKGISFVLDSECKNEEIVVYPRSLSGTVSDLQRLLRPLDFPGWITSIPIEGFVVGKGNDKGWRRDKNLIWSGELDGEIFDGYTTKPLFDNQIHSLSCDYHWNFGEHDFSIEHLSAKVNTAQGKEYALFADPLSLAGSEKSPISFDFWMTDEQEDLLRIAGQWTACSDTSSMHFTLNPQSTHIGTLSPKVCNFTLKGWQELIEGKCIFEVPAPLFAKEINRIPTSISTPLVRFITTPLDSIQPTGSVAVNLNYNSAQEILVAKVKGHGLKEKDNAPFRLTFSGEKNGPCWEIEECIVGPLSFSGEVEQLDEGWSIGFLGLEYGDWVVCGCQGTYDLENNTIHLLSPLAAIDGGLLSHIYSLPCSGFWRGKAESLITLDAHHKLKNISAKGSGQLERCSIGQFELEGETPLSFELINGEVIKISHWEGACTLYTSHPFAFDNLSYHLKTGKFFVEHALGQCDPHWMKPLSNLVNEPFKEYLSYIEGENPILFEWKSSLLKHEFSCSELPLKSVSLKNLRGSIDPAGYDIEGALESRIETCLFHLTPEGMLLETTEGESIGKLQFSFDAQCVCRSISGNGKGFTLLLENQEDHWTGSLHCDLDKLLPLFSSSSFPIQGGEFVIEGGICKNSFEGALRMNRVAFSQGCFDHIDALINYQNSEWTITDLHLFDPHLHLVAPQIICKKADQAWEIFSKKITGTNLFPMQLQQVFLGDIGKPHPLKIESFTLRDLNSCYPFTRWTGSGSLQFCHLFPLDQTPNLTIPQEQLSTILSVDPKWLLPSSGEVEFTLSQDSILVERFKEFYSEGKGIRFELTSDDQPAQIFWDGTWHLPLKLKPHNLPIKWVEMVTLTLTGNFQDPQLQWSARK